MTSVLEQIVTKIPALQGDAAAPLQALIFDSLYDSYKGVIVFCRIIEWYSVRKGTQIKMMATGAKADVVEVGYFGAGQFIPCEELEAGMVGYITASIKNVRDTMVGDTITDAQNPCKEPFRDIKSDSDGLLRSLSGRRRKIPGSQGCTGKITVK
ncbi:MAG: hypothetical protein ACLR8Q_01570 [[Ruminococcus] lactaris]|uniref:hypothetical protein n=1 Tax=[Ruminococcus] lactaris TaxID=46228 RepID=UPI0039A344EB